MNEKLPPAILVAELSGIDFLNSIAVPVSETIEWLPSGEGLVSWLEQAGLVSPAVLKEVQAAAGPGELDAVAAQARALREWFRGFVERHRGQPLSASVLSEIEPLNRMLARDEQFAQIATKDHAENDVSPNSSLQLVQQRRWRSAEALLLPIATAMAECVTSVDFTYVKPCEGHNCTLYFYDTTRRRARRWCSMAICGNRAKQAAHRDRIAQKKEK